MYKGDAMWEMNAAHHKELLQVAETQRSLARVRELPQKSNARALHFIGDVLISIGSRLKAGHPFATHEVA
jgi:hypothetical protein